MSEGMFWLLLIGFWLVCLFIGAKLGKALRRHWARERERKWEHEAEMAAWEWRTKRRWWDDNGDLV